MQYSVKDFVRYNNPCFVCGKRFLIKIIANSIESVPSEINSITYSPAINNNVINIKLQITYKSILHLSINSISNRFETNNESEFFKFISEYNLSLISQCQCGANIQTSPMEFNLGDKIIYPLNIIYEKFWIHINDDDVLIISTDYNKKETTFTVHKKASNVWNPFYLNKFILPLLPLQVFKNKENILKKLNTYLVFS